MTQSIYYWQEQNMFKSPNELKDYMKEFIGEGSFSYLETHSERFFRSYQILSNYNHNFEKEILVNLASNNGIFVPAIHAISPFKQIHLIDYGEKNSENLKIQSSQEVINVKKHYLNLEKDYLPFKDESVDVVIFFEIWNICFTIQCMSFWKLTESLR
jgi:hypothetical protein